MSVMVTATNQKLFEEISEHLIQDEKPSIYITSLSKDSNYHQYPFTMLWKLKTTEQAKKHHPEGNVWNHSMLVLDEAASVRGRCKDSNVFMWAALLHDIGKPDTTRMRNGKITSYDHDKIGEKLCIEFLSVITENDAFINKVAALVRYHMHMLYVLKELPYGDVDNMLRRVDVNEIALLGLCDRLGRTDADRKMVEAEYQDFLIKLKRMSNHNTKKSN